MVVVVEVHQHPALIMCVVVTAQLWAHLCGVASHVYLEGGGLPEAHGTQGTGVGQQQGQVVLLYMHYHLLLARELEGTGRAWQDGRVLAHVCPALCLRGKLYATHHTGSCWILDAMLQTQVPLKVSLTPVLLQTHNTLQHRCCFTILHTLTHHLKRVSKLYTQEGNRE